MRKNIFVCGGAHFKQRRVFFVVLREILFSHVLRSVIVCVADDVVMKLTTSHTAHDKRLK